MLSEIPAGQCCVLRQRLPPGAPPARQLSHSTTDKRVKFTAFWPLPCPSRKRKETTSMTVLLVLATFLVFIVLDYALNRRTAAHPATAAQPQPVPAHAGGDYVE